MENLNLISVLIVENEHSTHQYYKRLFKENGYVVAGIATTAEDAIRLFEETKPSLVLLDIELDNGSSGIDVGRYIAQHNPVPMIFISHFAEKPEYWEETMRLGMGRVLVKGTQSEKGLLLEIKKMLYKLSDIQFLVDEQGNKEDRKRGKPDLDEVTEIMMEATGHALSLNDCFYYSPKRGMFEKVNLDDIAYIEAKNDKCNLHKIQHAPNHNIVLNTSMKKLEEKLPNFHFMRVHSKYIINLKYLKTIKQEMAYLSYGLPNDKPISIGDTYKQNLESWLEKRKI